MTVAINFDGTELNLESSWNFKLHVNLEFTLLTYILSSRLLHEQGGRNSEDTERGKLHSSVTRALHGSAALGRSRPDQIMMQTVTPPAEYPSKSS